MVIWVANLKWLKKLFVSPDGKTIKKKVELFTWEKLDYVKKVKQAFKLK